MDTSDLQHFLTVYKGKGGQRRRRGKGKVARTVSVDQLHVQLPQLPQLLPIRAEHLVRQHVRLEHLAQHAVDEQRPPLVKDVFPRSLPPAARDPVDDFHQFGRVVGEVEEVERYFRFGVDVGEVLLDPRPGEGSDSQVTVLELGVWVWGCG